MLPGFVMSLTSPELGVLNMGERADMTELAYFSWVGLESASVLMPMSVKEALNREHYLLAFASKRTTAATCPSRSRVSFSDVEALPLPCVPVVPTV